MRDDYDLTTRPVPGLIRKIAIPASVGFFFNTMFNVVDTFYGGLISTQVLASLSLSFPLFFLIIAIGSGIATGATALIANAYGAGDLAGAKMFAIQGIAFGVLVSLGLTAFGIYSSPFLFGVLGATGEYLLQSLMYMNTIFAGSILFIVNYMFNAILNALGDTRSFRNFLIIGFFLNIALDPWFIYGGLFLPPMGITGIALATLVVELIGCFYLGMRVAKTELICDRCAHDIIPKTGPFRQIAYQGFPASINLMTVGLGIFIITYFISIFGKEAVAAYGVAIRVEQIILLPSIGLNIATMAIVAQNNGAGLFDRIRQVLNTSLKYGGFCMAAGTVIMLLFGPVLMGVFTRDTAVITIGSHYLSIAAFILYAYVILYVSVAALQGVKRPVFPLIIGLLRQIILPFAVFFILVRILDVGLSGIWWGIFGITWSAAVFTFFYTRHVLNKAMPHVL